MTTPVNTKPPRRRRALTLVLVAGACGGLWLGAHSLRRVRADAAPAAPSRASPATAGAHPDFRGDWELDAQASESLVPLVRAMGKSALKGRILSGLPMTQSVRGDH